MTFRELQDELISVAAARFKETQRTQIKSWINDRYAELWSLENWTFKQAATTFPVVAGNADPVEPTDIGVVIGLWNQYGEKLQYLTPSDYFSRHIASTYTGAIGIPSCYTLVNRQIKLDTTPSENGTYTLLYQKALTLLVADSDVPALPAECHYPLVHGAIASGSVMVNDFTYQFAEQRWANIIAAMRQNYLADTRGEPTQWGLG